MMRFEPARVVATHPHPERLVRQPGRMSLHYLYGWPRLGHGGRRHFERGTRLGSDRRLAQGRRGRDWLASKGRAGGRDGGLVDTAIETATGESDCSHGSAHARQSCFLVGTEKNESSPPIPADLHASPALSLYRVSGAVLQLSLASLARTRCFSGRAQLALAAQLQAASMIRSPLLPWSRPSRIPECAKTQSKLLYELCLSASSSAPLHLSLLSPLPASNPSRRSAPLERCRALQRRGQRAMQAAGTQTAASTLLCISAGAPLTQARVENRGSPERSTRAMARSDRQPEARRAASPGTRQGMQSRHRPVSLHLYLHPAALTRARSCLTSLRLPTSATQGILTRDQQPRSLTGA